MPSAESIMCWVNVQTGLERLFASHHHLYFTYYVVCCRRRRLADGTLYRKYTYLEALLFASNEQS